MGEQAPLRLTFSMAAVTEIMLELKESSITARSAQGDLCFRIAYDSSTSLTE